MEKWKKNLFLYFFFLNLFWFCES